MLPLRTRDGAAALSGEVERECGWLRLRRAPEDDDDG
jgi:hypothetical protein